MNLNRWQMAKTPASILKMAVSLAAIMVVKSLPVLASPMGATVQAGTAEIATDGLGTTTVQQSSDRAVIGWQSFNLAANETVNFIQPSATSATLNRILDSGVSRIAGTINATGTVYFTNPNGLVFDATSRVTANGFIASTIAPSTIAFMNEIETGTGAVAGAIGLNGTIKAPLVSVLARSLDVTGHIDASSAVQVGGKIELTASGAVTIGAAAIISASGVMGGGAIAIGGNFKGEGPLLNADSVTVASGARITADANGTAAGDGGSVVLWSQKQTRFAGAISSRGAAAGGNGGTVEVSGLANLIYRGTVDNHAPKGKTGTLLLDPNRISILGSEPAEPTDPVQFTSGAYRSLDSNIPSYMLISDLQNALATSNVTLDAQLGTDGEIVVGAEGDSIVWSSGNSLTLNARTAITIKAATINAGATGSIIFNTINGDIKLGNRNPSGGTAADIIITAGSLFMNLGTGKITDDLGEQIKAEGATVYYQGARPTGGINSKVLDLGTSGRFVFVTVIASLEANAEITIGASGIVASVNPGTPIDPIGVQLSDYRVTAGSGQFSLTGIYSNNILNLNGLRSAPQYDALAYIRGKGIAVTGNIALKQSLLLDSSDWMTVNGTIGSNDAQANGRSLSLVADKYVNQTNGIILADGLTVTTRGGIYLGANNRIIWLGRVRAGGDSVLVVDPSINLLLKGDINLGSAAIDLRAGGLILDQNISLTAGRATIKLAGNGSYNGTLAAGSKSLNFNGNDLYYLGAAPTITDGGQNAAIAVGSARFTQIIALNSATNLAVSDTGYSTDSGTVVFGSNRLLDLHVSGTGNPTNGDNEALAFYGFEVGGAVNLKATAGGTTARLSYLRAAGLTVASDFTNLPSLTLISSGGIILQASLTSASGKSLSLYSQGWIRQKSGVIDTSRLILTSARTVALGSGIDLGSANRIRSLGEVNGDTIFGRGAESGSGQVLVRIADNRSLSLDGDIRTGGKAVSSFIELSGTNLTLTLARNLTLEAYLTRLDLGTIGLVAAGDFTLSGVSYSSALVYNGLEPTTNGGANKAIVFSAARFVLLTPVNENINLTATGIFKDSDPVNRLTLLTWGSTSRRITVRAASQGIVASGSVTIDKFNATITPVRYIKGNGIEVKGDLVMPVDLVMPAANGFIDSTAGIKISASITVNNGTNGLGTLTLIARGGDIVQDGTGTIVSGGLMVRGNAKVSLANPNQLGTLFGFMAGGDSLLVQRDDLELKLSGDMNFGSSKLELRAGNILLNDDITVVGRQLDLMLSRVRTVTPLTYQDTVKFDAGNFTLTGDGLTLKFMGSVIRRGRVIANSAQGTFYRAIDLGGSGSFTQVWRYDIAEDITIDETGLYSTVNPNYKLINNSLINLTNTGIFAGGNKRNSDGVLVAYQEITSTGPVSIGLIDGLNLGMINLVRVQAAGIKIFGSTRFSNSLTLVSSKDIEFNHNLTVLNDGGKNGLNLFAVGAIRQNGGAITANLVTASAKGGVDLRLQNDIAQLGPINQAFTINDTEQSGGGKVTIDASGGDPTRSLKLSGDMGGLSLLLRANGLVLTRDIEIHSPSLSLDLGGGGINANSDSFKITSDAERLFFTGDFSDSAAGTIRLSLTNDTAQFYRTEFSSSDSFILSGRAESSLPATAPPKPNWVTGGVAGTRSALFARKEVILEATTSSLTFERDSNGDEILTQPIVTPLNPPYDYFGYDYISAETIKVAGTASGIRFKDSVTLTASKDIILNSGVTVKNGSLTLTAGGVILQTGGVISTNSLSLTAGGRIYLGQGNGIVQLNTVTAGGAVTIKNHVDTSLALAGDIDLGNNSLWLSARDLSLNQSITVTARQVTLRSLNGGLNAGLFTLTATGADMTYTGSAPVTSEGGSNQAIDLGAGIFTFNQLNHSTEAVVFDQEGVKSGAGSLTLITSLSLAEYRVAAGGTAYSFETLGSLSIKSVADLQGLPSLTAASVTLEDGLQLTAPLALTATDADGAGIVLSGAITASSLTLNSLAGISQDSGSLLTVTHLNLTAMKAATVRLGENSSLGHVNQGFNFEAQFSQPTAAAGQVTVLSDNPLSLNGNLLGTLTITAPSLTLAQAVTVNGSGSVLTLNLGRYANGDGYGLTARYNRLIFNNTAFNLTSTGSAFDVGGGSLTVNYSASGDKNLSEFNLLTSDRVTLAASDKTTGQTTLGQFLTTVEITDGTLTVDRAVAVAAVSLTTIGSGSIQVNAPLIATGSLSLHAAGDIGQNAAGAIQLLGNQGQASLVAGGTIELTNKNNDLRSLSIVSSDGVESKLSLVTRYGMGFTNRLTSRGAIDLSSGGAIGFYGAAVTAEGSGGVTINSLAAVTGDQDSVLTVGSGGLSGSAVGGFFLEGLNRIATLGSLVNQSVGGIRLRNSIAMTIARGSQLQGGEGGVQLVQSRANLSLAGSLTVQGSWLRLDFGSIYNGLTAGAYGINAKGLDLYYYGAAPTIDGIDHAAIDIGGGSYIGILDYNNANNRVLVLDATLQIAVAVAPTTIRANGARLSANQVFTGIKSFNQIRITGSGDGLIYDIDHTTAGRLRYIEGSGIVFDSQRSYKQGLMLVSSRGSVTQLDPIEPANLAVTINAGILITAGLGVEGEGNNLVLIDEYREDNRQATGIQLGIYIANSAVSSVSSNLTMIQAGTIRSKDRTARGIVLETAVILAGNNLTLLQTGSLSAATDKSTVTLGNEPNPFYAGSPWAEPETQTSAIGISDFRYQIGKEADRRIIDQNRLSSGRNLVVAQNGLVRSGGGSAIGIELRYLILDAGTDLSLVQNGLVSGGDRVSGMVLQSSNFTAKGNLAFNQWGQLDQAGTVSLSGRTAVAGIRMISLYNLNNPGTPVFQSATSAWDYTTYYLPNLKSRQALSFTGGSAKNSWLQFSTRGSDLLLSGSNNFDFNAARVLIDLGGSSGAVAGDQGRIVSLGVSGLLANSTEIDNSITNSITANGLDLFYLGGSPMTAVAGGTLFTLGNGSFTRLTGVAGDLSIDNSVMTETVGGISAAVNLITNSSALLGLVFANPATTVKTGLLARGDVTVGLVSAAATNGANELSFIGGSRLTTNDDLTLSGNLILAAFGSNGFGAAESDQTITSGIWVQKSITLNSKGVGTGGDRADAAGVLIPSDSELGLFNFSRITAGKGGSAVGIRLGNGVDNAQLTSGSLLTVANLGAVTVTSGNGSAVGISNSRMGLLTGTMLRVINMGAITTAPNSTAAARGILIEGGAANGSRSDLFFASRGIRGNVRDVEADLSNLSGNIQNRGVITSSHGTASGIEFNRVSLKGWDRLNLISSAPVSSVTGNGYGLWLNRSQLLAGSIATASVSLQLQKGAAIETRSSSATAIGIEITASQIVSRNDIKFILDDGVTIVNRGKPSAIIGVQWTATGSLSDQAVRLTAGGSPANFISVTTGGFNLVLNDNGRGMVGESGLILEQGAVQLDFIHQRAVISTTTNGGSTSLDPNDPSLNGRLVSNGHTISARGLKLYYAGQMPTVSAGVPAVQLGNGEFTYYQKYASDVYLSDSRVGLGKVYWSLNDVLANTGAVDLTALDGTAFDGTLMLVYDTNGVLKTNWTIGDVKRNLGSLLTAKGLTKFSEGLTYGVYLKQRGLDLTVRALPEIVGIATTGATSNGIWAGGTLTVNGINNNSYGLLAGQAIRVENFAVTVPNSLLIWGYGNPQFSLKDAFNNASNIGIYLNHGTTTIKTTGSQSDLTILQSGTIFSTYAGVVNAGIYDVANDGASLEAGRNLNIIQSSSATINGSEVRAIRLASDRYVAGGDILIAQLGTLTSRDRPGFGLYFRVRGFVENRFVANNLISLIANNQNLYLEGVANNSAHPSFAFYAPVTRINLGSGTVIQGSAGVEGYINAISNSRALNRLTFMGAAPTVYYTGGDPIAMINGASAPTPVIDTSFSGANAYAFELGGRTLDDGSVTRANRGTGTFIRLWQVDGDVTLDGDSQDWRDASSTAAKTAARVNAANFLTGISVNGTATLNSFSATATATAGRVTNGGLSVIEASAIDITGTASFVAAVQLRSQWGITQTASGSLTTSKLSLTAGDRIDLGSATNQIASLGRVVTASTGLVNFSLSNGSDLNLSDEILVTGAVLIDVGNHNINLTKAIRIAAPRTILKGGSYNSGGFMLSTNGGDLGLEVATVTDGGLTRVIDLQGTGRYLLQQFSSNKTSYLYSGLSHGTTSDADAEWRNIDDFTLRTSLPSGLAASQINGLVSSGDATPTNLVLAGIDLTGNRNFTTSGTIGIIGDNRVSGDLTLSAAAITQSNSQSSLTVGQQVSLTATRGAINLSGINQMASISSLSAVGGGITLRNGGSLTLQLATISSGGEVKFIQTRGDLILTRDLVSSGGAVTIDLTTGNYDNRDFVWDSSNQNLTLNAIDYLGSKTDGAVGFKIGSSGQFSGNFTQAILVNSPFDSTKQNYFFTTDDESTWAAGKVAAGFNDEESQWLSYDILKQSQPALLLQRLAGNDGLVQWQNSTVLVTAPKKSLYFYNLNLREASPGEKIQISGYSLTFLGNNRFQGDVKLVSETIISQLPDSVLDVSGVLTLQSGGAIDLSSSQNQLTHLGAVNAGGTVQIGNGRDLSLKGNIVSAGAITIGLSQGNLILNQDIDSRGGAVLLELGSGSYDNRGESLETQRIWTSNNQKITLNAASYLGDRNQSKVGFKVGNAGFAGNLANNRPVVFDLTKRKFYFTSDAETYWDYYQYLAGFNDSDSQWLNYDHLANNSSAPGLYTKNGEVRWGTVAGSFLPDDLRYSVILYSVRSAKTTVQTILATEIKFFGTNSFGGDLSLQTTAGAISQADDSRLSLSGTLSLKAKTGIALETSHSNGNQIAALGAVTANGAIRINSRGDLSLKGSINSDFDTIGANHEIAIGLSQGNLYLTQNIESMGGNVAINITAGGYDNRAEGQVAPWLWRSRGKDMVLNAAHYLGSDQDHGQIIDLGSATARFTSNLMKAPSILDRSKRNLYFTNLDRADWQALQEQAGFDGFDSQWFDLSDIDRLDSSAGIVASGNGVFGWNSAFKLGANHNLFFVNVKRGNLVTPLTVNQVTMIGNNSFNSLSITTSAGLVISGDGNWFRAKSLTLGGNSDLILGNRIQLTIDQVQTADNRLNLKIDGDFNESLGFALNQFAGLTVTAIGNGGRITLGNSNRAFTTPLTIKAENTSLSLRLVAAGDVVINGLETGGGSASFRVAGNLTVDGIIAGAIDYNSGGFTHLSGNFAAVSGHASSVYLESHNAALVVGNNNSDGSFRLGGSGGIILAGDISSNGGSIELGDGSGQVALARDADVTSHGGTITIGNRIEGGFIASLNHGLRLNAGLGSLAIHAPLGTRISLGWLEISAVGIAYDSLTQTDRWYEIKSKGYGKLQPLPNQPLQLGLSR